MTKSFQDLLDKPKPVEDSGVKSFVDLLRPKSTEPDSVVQTSLQPQARGRDRLQNFLIASEDFLSKANNPFQIAKFMDDIKGMIFTKEEEVVRNAILQASAKVMQQMKDQIRESVVPEQEDRVDRVLGFFAGGDPGGRATNNLEKFLSQNFTEAERDVFESKPAFKFAIEELAKGRPGPALFESNEDFLNRSGKHTLSFNVAKKLILNPLVDKASFDKEIENQADELIQIKDVPNLTQLATTGSLRAASEAFRFGEAVNAAIILKLAQSDSPGIRDFLNKALSDKGLLDVEKAKGRSFIETIGEILFDENGEIKDRPFREVLNKEALKDLSAEDREIVTRIVNVGEVLSPLDVIGVGIVAGRGVRAVAGRVAPEILQTTTTDMVRKIFGRLDPENELTSGIVKNIDEIIPKRLNAGIAPQDVDTEISAQFSKARQVKKDIPTTLDPLEIDKIKKTATPTEFDVISNDQNIAKTSDDFEKTGLIGPEEIDPTILPRFDRNIPIRDVDRNLDQALFRTRFQKAKDALDVGLETAVGKGKKARNIIQKGLDLLSNPRDKMKEAGDVFVGLHNRLRTAENTLIPNLQQTWFKRIDDTLAGFSKEAGWRIFRAVDNTPDDILEASLGKRNVPIAKAPITSEELEAAETIRKFVDELADRTDFERSKLGLLPINRRENYITHLVIDTFDDKIPFISEHMIAMPFQREIFDPFFKTRKGSKKIIMDPLRSLAAYTDVLARKINYDPILADVFGQKKTMRELAVEFADRNVRGFERQKFKLQGTIEDAVRNGESVTSLRQELKAIEKEVSDGLAVGRKKIRELADRRTIARDLDFDEEVATRLNFKAGSKTKEINLADDGFVTTSGAIEDIVDPRMKAYQLAFWESINGNTKRLEEIFPAMKLLNIPPIIARTLNRFVRLGYYGALGLNVKFTLLNLTQVKNTIPELGLRHTFRGYSDIARINLKRTKNLFTRGELGADFDILDEINLLNDANYMATHLVGDVNQMSLRHGLNKFQKFVMINVRESEFINKGAAGYGALRKFATENTPGHDIYQLFAGRTGRFKKQWENAKNFALDVINDTQFLPTIADKPLIFRKKEFQSGFQFQQFALREATFATKKVFNALREGKKVAGELFTVFNPKGTDPKLSRLRLPNFSQMTNSESAKLAKFLGAGTLTTMGTFYALGYRGQRRESRDKVIFGETPIEKAVGVAQSAISFDDYSSVGIGPVFQRAIDIVKLTPIAAKAAFGKTLTKREKKFFERFGDQMTIFIPASSQGKKIIEAWVEYERIDKPFFEKPIEQTLLEITPAGQGIVQDVVRGVLNRFTQRRRALSRTAFLLNKQLPATEEIIMDRVFSNNELVALMGEIGIDSATKFKKWAGQEDNIDLSMTQIIMHAFGFKSIRYEDGLNRIRDIILDEEAKTEAVLQSALILFRKGDFDSLDELLVKNENRIGQEEIKSLRRRAGLKNLSQRKKKNQTLSDRFIEIQRGRIKFD